MVAEAGAIEGADHTEDAGGAKAAVAAGDSVLGDPEDFADEPERGAAIDLQGMHQPRIDVIQGDSIRLHQG
ncbi:hypothetical protein Sliba_17390 [Streptomyces nigrescens]|uniref:Uncharacterized protein n=1 Tax=Streptomyces nigrescens TaxID=1920 RepID=A0A640TGC9_STRNI|nr:hypothetical protein Sliba_17390 [Streptomyces libani subsp. libani]GGW02670.1 hypothetical protein GCM10010500_60620 [Streptomyces libani subsp. libani]